MRERLEPHRRRRLRSVDGALVAHGRDNGYEVAAWFEHAFSHARRRAHPAARRELEEMPAGALVDAAADALADVVIALHRDRVGVPECLADALGSLLALDAVGAGTDR